jgi:hypothetical protein
MNLSDEIKQLMDRAEREKSASPAKKHYNKVIARLEEAWLWSLQIEPSVSDRYETCTCPPGAVDNSCPVHGQK